MKNHQTVHWFYRLIFAICLQCFCCLTSVYLLSSASFGPAYSKERMILIVGAGGEEIYAEQFLSSALQWQQVAKRNQFELTYIGPAANELPEVESSKSLNDKQKLQNTIADLDGSPDPLWIVMLGHGTFQQGVANFNLEGPDINADEMASLLEQLRRPVILIHAFSSSGPWLGKLSQPNRVIITATRSGEEQNYSRFGSFLARAINSSDSDLDHDLNLSILEAFLKACADTEQFYQAEGRLQTEHALLDDNGDGLGTPPDFFRGVRVVKQASEKNQPDGEFAVKVMVLNSEQQRTLTAEKKLQVADLEAQILELRTKRNQLSEDQYFQELEPLLVKLARLELQPDSND